MLRQSSIILMDEASANVDSATDQMLQQMMRTCFAHATVVVVAHRVNTILDCGPMVATMLLHLPNQPMMKV